MHQLHEVIDNRYGVFWNVVFLIGNLLVRYAAAIITALIALAVLCCCLGGCGGIWNGPAR